MQGRGSGAVHGLGLRGIVLNAGGGGGERQLTVLCYSSVQNPITGATGTLFLVYLEFFLNLDHTNKDFHPPAPVALKVNTGPQQLWEAGVQFISE